MTDNDGRSGPQGEQTILARAQGVRAADQAPSPTLDFKLSDLVARHEADVRRLCLRICGDAAKTDELAQEALLQAWQRLPDFDPQRGTFGAWIYGIARFVAFNAVRKHGELLAEDGILEAGDEQAISVLQRLAQQEREELLRRVSVAVLDATEQEAVFLRYTEGMAQDSITTVLGITEASGARGVLQRCRRKLQRELRRELAELGHGSSFIRIAED